MAANYKYQCSSCEDVRIYFDGAIDTEEFRCPSCCDTTLIVAGYSEDGNLEVFELLHKVDALYERVENLEEIFAEPKISVKPSEIN